MNEQDINKAWAQEKNIASDVIINTIGDKQNVNVSVKWEDTGWSSGGVKIQPHYYIEWIIPPNSGEIVISSGQVEPSSPQTSGRSTFIIGDGAEDGSAEHAWKISIDLSTLNPLEFYEIDANTNSDDSSYYSSVYRHNDEHTSGTKTRVNTGMNPGDIKEEPRYKKIRSMEIVIDKFVSFVDTDANDNSIRTINSVDDSRDRLNPAKKPDGTEIPDEYYKYYGYCERFIDDSDPNNHINRTKIKIVNCDHIIEEKTIEIPFTLYDFDSNDTQPTVSYDLSYIATTSVYKGKYKSDSYKHVYRQLTNQPSEPIKQWCWTLDYSNPEISDSESGHKLKFSLDDGVNIHVGSIE